MKIRINWGVDMRLYNTLLSILIIAVVSLALSGCGDDRENTASSLGYRQMSAEEAKNLMDSEENYVILDVRTQEEYDQGHIPGALLIPHDAIAKQAQDILTDKNQLILVYCRSGNRSKQASASLVELGYTNVVEFGGINDWPYEIEE